jgi:hypothetical protein
MKALKNINIERVVFLDIETVRAEKTLTTESRYFGAWEYYCINNKKEDVFLHWEEKAALFPEFAFIACITVGVFHNGEVRMITYQGEEKQLIQDFFSMLSKSFNKKGVQICGHAIINFDAPFIMKRAIINGIELHPLFDIAGLKPWEVPYLDTADLWKGSSYHKSSLISITTALGLPSPKDDISGKDVSRVYYEGGIDRIVKYCEKDVRAVMEVVMRFRGEQMPSEKPGLLERLFAGEEYTTSMKSKLKAVIKTLSPEDKERVKVLLNSLVSRARGKETDLTKKDVNELLKCEY